MQVLLDWAVSQFGSSQEGSSAQDIFQAMHHPDTVRAEHEKEVTELTNDKLLQHLLYASPSIGEVDPAKTSHRIISISPIFGPPFDTDRFDIQFKSKPIGDRVIGMVKCFEYEEALQLIKFCRNVQGGNVFAREVFEAIGHRLLIGRTSIYRSMFSTYKMIAQGTDDAPIFTTATRPSGSKFFTHRTPRTLTSVNLDDPFPNGDRPLETLYFVPTSSSNPLIDSFAIDYSSSKRNEVNAEIWIFQMTLSGRSPGSSSGYEQVKTVVKAAQAYGRIWLEENQTPSGTRSRSPRVTIATTVHYVFVCPYEHTARTWAMPNGWLSIQEGVSSTAECFLVHLDVILP